MVPQVELQMGLRESGPPPSQRARLGMYNRSFEGSDGRFGGYNNRREVGALVVCIAQVPTAGIIVGCTGLMHALQLHNGDLRSVRYSDAPDMSQASAYLLLCSASAPAAHCMLSLLGCGNGRSVVGAFSTAGILLASGAEDSDMCDSFCSSQAFRRQCAVSTAQQQTGPDLPCPGPCAVCTPQSAGCPVQAGQYSWSPG